MQKGASVTSRPGHPWISVERSKKIAFRLIDEAKDSVADMGDGALPLLSMADLVIDRSS